MAAAKYYYIIYYNEVVVSADSTLYSAIDGAGLIGNELEVTRDGDNIRLKNYSTLEPRPSVYVKYGSNYYYVVGSPPTTAQTLVELTNLTPIPVRYLDSLVLNLESVGVSTEYELHDARIADIDSAPTANSNNLVKSGGVKAYVDGKTGDLTDLDTTDKSSLVAAINEAAGGGGGGGEFVLTMVPPTTSYGSSHVGNIDPAITTEAIRAAIADGKQIVLCGQFGNEGDYMRFYLQGTVAPEGAEEGEAGDINELAFRTQRPYGGVFNGGNSEANVDISGYYGTDRPVFYYEWTTPAISQNIETDKTVTSKTTSPKAVADYVDGKAVPSGGSSGQVLAKASGADHDLVWVPQNASSMRPLFEACGALYNDTGADITQVAPWGENVTHKDGHYYLNGLGDITEAQMLEIYAQSFGLTYDITRGRFQGSTCRTIIPARAAAFNWASAKNATSLFSMCPNIEVVRYLNIGPNSANEDIPDISSFQSPFYKCLKLVYAGVWRVGSANLVTNVAPSKMRFLYLKGLKVNLSISGASQFDLGCLAYMINNAGTATITITVHATVYAAALQDTDVQAALTAKTNVTLASA